MPVLFDLAAWGKIPSQVQAYFFSNENLITGEVINWSYSHNLVRFNLPVNVPNEVDLEKVRDLLLGTAARVQRVLKDPEPSCLMCGSTTPRMASVLLRATCIGTFGKNFGSTTLDSLPPKRRLPEVYS